MAKYEIYLQQNGRYSTFETANTLKQARKIAIEHIRDCKIYPLQQKGSIYTDGHASLVHPAFGHDASATITLKG